MILPICRPVMQCFFLVGVSTYLTVHQKQSDTISSNTENNSGMKNSEKKAKMKLRCLFRIQELVQHYSPRRKTQPLIFILFPCIPSSPLEDPWSRRVQETPIQASFSGPPLGRVVGPTPTNPRLGRSPKIKIKNLMKYFSSSWGGGMVFGRTPPTHQQRGKGHRPRKEACSARSARGTDWLRPLPIRTPVGEDGVRS